MVLQVISNEELVKKEKEAAEKAMEERQSEDVILGLASHMRECWDAARQAKKPIENIMIINELSNILNCPLINSRL